MITITHADLTLLQDAGRFGFETSGVPRSGAWDREQYQRLAALLEEENLVVFEVLAGRFEFTTDQSIDLALSGSLSSNVGAVDQLVSVPAGKVAITTSGTSYVGIAGLQATRVLGSASTDTVSGLGPERVMAGQNFEVAPSRNKHRLIRTPLETRESIRFIPGPHADLERIETTVVSKSRSGIRLGTATDLGRSLTLASLPIAPGAIQNTGSELIIVGPDGGVSGGYLVVGVVINEDLGALARFNQGERITLKPIALEQVPATTQIKVVDASQL